MRRFARRFHGAVALTAPFVALVCHAWLACVTQRVVTAAEAAPQDAVQMAVVFLAKDDVAQRSIGLDRIRYGTKGDAATRTFASLLPTLAPGRQIELLAALEDRGDHTAVAAAVVLAGTSTDEAVRAAAVRCIGAIGGAAEVRVLLQSLTASDLEKAAARRGLVVVGGPNTVAAIMAAAKSAEPGVRATLLEILADRRERAAVADIAAAASDDNAVVRTAAMRSLGRMGGPDQVAAMVQGVLKAAAGAERDQAERSLVAVCTQNSGKDLAAALFLKQFKSIDDSSCETLLPTVGRIGGLAAVTIVEGMIADPDAAKRKLGLTALTRWPDASVSERLLDLLGKAKDPAERELLLGSLIRIAPLPDNKLNDKQKLELLEKTMALCQRDEDRRRVLERANAIRMIETLRFVVPYLEDPNLAEPACLSVVELAHHRNLRDAHKDEFTKALDRVLTLTKNEELLERASRYKEGQTWERKKPAAKG